MKKPNYKNDVKNMNKNADKKKREIIRNLIKTIRL